MKFIPLQSRGGNYLVVAQNIAWLRTAENGQTNVGMVGGQPLLVVGSIEEVSAQIMEAIKGMELSPAPTPAVTDAPPRAATTVQPAVAIPARDKLPERPAPMLAPSRSRQVTGKPLPLSERIARAAGPKVTSGSQRFMGKTE